MFHDKNLPRFCLYYLFMNKLTLLSCIIYTSYSTGGKVVQKIVEQTFSEQGVNIHLIPSKKFKTITIVAKLRAPLQKKTITKRALVPYLLNQGTKSYPSEKDLQSKLDELYGANLSIDGMKKGDYHIISFRLEIANETFLWNKEKIFDEALNLLQDVIFHPNVEQEKFPEEQFNREKETLKNEIRAIVDDKMAYANMRLIDEMFKGNPYSIHVQGYEDDLSRLNSKNVYAYYKKMLVNDAFDVYVLGYFNEQNLLDKLKRTFIRSQATSSQNISTTLITKNKHPQEVIEVEPIQQAKLHIGYTTECMYKDDHYFALHILNGLFGGFPNSKLFVHVREKNSLAYYASSRLESHKGLLIVFCGIEGKDYIQTKDIINQQLQALKEGQFTEIELEETKELIISQLKESLDHPQGIVELSYQQVLGEKKLSPDQFIENIEKVTKSDVIQVALNINEHTTFLLKNKGSDHDATAQI